MLDTQAADDTQSLTPRPFDVILWGATGFTGSLAAEYLVENYLKRGLRFAIGGRSEGKLSRLKAAMALVDPAASDLQVFVGDSHDRPFLSSMAAKTKVICSTVGPYAKYGEDLVAACAASGTDYCDLTAEVPFIRRMIDAYDGEARRTGARIVHSCGFDSIPSDLGTLLLQKTSIEWHGKPCRSVRLYLGESQGGFSGGTIASAVYLAESIDRDPSLKELMADPYALNPEGMRDGPDDTGQQGVLFDRELGQWTAPFVMEASNTRVVRRTNALLGWSYGRGFTYSESMATGPGLAGWLKAAGVAAMLGAFGTALAYRTSRQLLHSLFLPKPGEGPSEEKREDGYFRFLLEGRTDSGERIRVRVEADQDPGYTETAKMLVESAACLAVDELEVGGGSHTPASSMGLRLVDRLRARGVRFEVE